MDPTLIAGAIVILLFSIIVHEVMHGLVALKFGDHTAEQAGRLTLNPIPHIDPIGSILVPLSLFVFGSPIMFGWAKPVPVNPFNFTNIKKGELYTASAGIAANFGLAITAALIFHLSGFFNLYSFQALAVITLKLNLVLAFFNLIPIPPLDGSKIVLSFLSTKTAIAYQKWEKYGLIILLLILISPVDFLGTGLNLLINFFMSIFGIN